MDGPMIKDPGARVDHGVDWGVAYLDGQQLLTGSSWSVTPDEPGGVAVDGHGFDPERTTVTLSGGREGVTYRVTNRVTLSDGQIDERSLTIRVEQR